MTSFNATWLAGTLCMLVHASVAVAADAPATGVSAPSTTTVKIDKYLFTMEEIHIRAGDSIAWVNEDEVPHTVVDAAGTFHSPALDTHEEFRYTFESAGKYRYFCSLHPQMIGTVIVDAR